MDEWYGCQMIPANSLKIIELRKRGYKPDELIIISLVGKLDEENYVIYADYRKDYDWKFLKDLDVCIFANSAVDFKKTLVDIAKVGVKFLGLWDVDRLEGADFKYLPYIDDSYKLDGKFKMRLYPSIWINMQNKIFNKQDWMQPCS